MSIHTGPPLVSVVIPNHNGAAFLPACLSSLDRQTYQDLEIIVVDNGSDDASVRILEQYSSARILRLDSNLGFAPAVNRGIRAAHGSWIAVLNNDTEVDPGWIEEAMAAAARHPEAAFIACRILDFQDRSRVYSAGDCFLRSGFGYRRGQELLDGPWYDTEEEVFAACGCAALYRKSTLEASRGFDSDFFAYFEDVDLGLRLQAAGLKGFYAPRSVVYHHGGGTSGGEFSALAVRLRTRNALLVVSKSLPGDVLRHCWPMILAGQLSWVARVLLHLKFWSYVRGLAGALFLFPEMLRRRYSAQTPGRNSAGHLWRAILASEQMASKDFSRTRIEKRSLFLTWYFRP